MTTPGNVNSVGEQANDNINSERRDSNPYATLTRKFVSSKLKNKRKRAGFVESVNRDGEMTPELLEQIRDFAGTHTDFSGLTIDASNITYSSLQKELSSYVSSLNNNREQVKNRFLQENHISASEYEKLIRKKIENLEEPELNSLLARSTQRTRFLQNIYGKNKLPKSRDVFEFLGEVDISKAYSKLSETDKILVKHAQNNFENGKKIDTTDLLTLFEANIFNDSQKKELLRIFIPNMTLSKAVSLGIYSQKDAKRYKKIIAKEAVAARGGNVDMIVANMKDSEISIPTYQLLSKTINVEKIIDDGNLLQDFVNDYNAVVDEVSDSMKNIKTLEDFQGELARYPEKVKSSNPMKNGAYDFKEGSIIEIRQTKKAEGSSEEIFLYGKILKAGNAGEIKLLDRGSGKYSTNSDVISTQTYDDLLKTVLGADTVSFTVMSEDDIKDKIYLGEIDEEAPDRLEQRTPDQIEEKRDELMKQLDARKAHLKSEGKTKEEIEADEEIEAISNKHRVLSDALEKVDEFNKNALLRELDELDPEGKKHGLDDWMTFRVGKGDQKDLVFTVTVVNPLSKKLLITSPGGNQEMDFQDFYYNFKQGDCKRISSKMTNFQGIIDSINIDGDIKIRPTWDGFEMKDGQLQKKESKTGLQYNFLAGAKGENEELLQIHDESGGLFTISFGKIKDKTEKKEVKGKDGNMKEEKKVTENFTVYKGTTVVTAGWLDEYIKKHKLVPRSLDDSKDATYNKGEELEQKFNPWSFLGKGLNIATVVASGKVFHESLENFFKDGRDERAARFAYAWGKHLLPGDMKTDLMSRIEDAQEKRMEDYLARLKKISSSAATKMIKGWLSDPHVKQEKHEAAVEFMLEKYGTLCAKGPLFPYQGKFKWYQALGGRLGDKLYKEEEQKALVSGQQFSEEALVWTLMVLQCKPEGFNGVKRRSKWYKKLKKLRSTGKDGELDTGRNDGKDERDIHDRIGGSMSELKGGNYPNAIGWLETVVDKGGSMYDMNKVPFVMAFSGAVYNFDPKVTNDAMKKFPAEGRLLMMMRFMSYTKDQDLLNETILEVCKSLENKGSQFKGIGAKAQHLHDNLKVSHPKGEGEKIKQVEDFYNKYGEAITNAMHMLNTGKTDGIGGNRSINKMILLEKGENKVFQRYYDAMYGFTESDDTNFEVADKMKDAFYKAGISGVHVNKFIRSNLEYTSANSFRKKDLGKYAWEEIEAELRATPLDKSLTEAQTKFHMRETLRGFLSGLIANGIHEKTLKQINLPTSPMARLGTWNMNLYEDLMSHELNAVSLLDEKNSNANSLLEKYANQIISVERGEQSYNSGVSVTGGGSRIGNVISGVGGDVAAELNKKKPVPSNDIDDPFDPDY